MSDASGTIFKVISIISSPKAAIKNIFIALTLVLSWKYLNNFVDSTSVPIEIKGLIVIFLSIGFGTLAGEVINRLGMLAYELTFKKYVQKKNDKLNKIRVVKFQKELLDHFKVTYKHLSFDVKELLWQLSKEPQPIWDDSDSDIPYRAMLDNGYIRQISRTNDHVGLYELHPCISNHILTNLEQEIDDMLSEFMDKHRECLIKIITTSNYLPLVTYSELYEKSRGYEHIVSIKNHYDTKGDPFSNIITGFDLIPNDYFRDILAERLGTPLLTRKFKVEVTDEITL